MEHSGAVGCQTRGSNDRCDFSVFSVISVAQLFRGMAEAAEAAICYGNLFADRFVKEQTITVWRTQFCLPLYTFVHYILEYGVWSHSGCVRPFGGTNYIHGKWASCPNAMSDVGILEN